MGREQEEEEEQKYESENMLKEGLIDNLAHGTKCLATEIIGGLKESLDILQQATKKTIVDTVEYKYGDEAG